MRSTLHHAADDEPRASEVSRSARRRYRLAVCGAQGEDALVNGNRDAITQILIALIDNATKFTQPGGTIGIQLQRAGGKRLAAADFLRGFALGAGAIFNAPPVA